MRSNKAELPPGTQEFLIIRRKPKPGLEPNITDTIGHYVARPASRINSGRLEFPLLVCQQINRSIKLARSQGIEIETIRGTQIIQTGRD